MQCIEVLGLPIPVWIRPLTAGDWCDYLDRAEGTIEANAWLVARCVCDDEGIRLFTDDAVATINGLSAGFVNHISDAVLRESGVAGRDWTAERSAFRKGTHQRFGYQLARDLDRDDADTFLSEMSPSQYQKWRFSYAFDPPVDDLLRATNALLAQLLAVYHNVNFVGDGKEHLRLTGADFLRTPDDDGDEDEPIDDGEEMGAPLHPMLQSGITGAAGIRPTGNVVPSSVMKLFGGTGDAEG